MSSPTMILPRIKTTVQTERRGWQAFWALPGLTTLLLVAHGGRVVELVYLPLALLIGLYLCLKFPRVYVAFALVVSTTAPMFNRIAASQSVLLPKSPLLAAPFLVVAMGAFRMWRARIPGLLSLIFLLPLLAVLYGGMVGYFTLGPKPVMIPLAGWLSPIFFGLYCFASEDDQGSLARMYVKTLILTGTFIAAYGLVQYFSPFTWDTDWLTQMQDQGMALSMGTPEATGMRIFATVSSPANAAVFLASAVLALSNVRTAWRLVGIALGLVTLILTSVRAAWLAFAIAAVILLLRATAKARVQAAVGMVVLVLVALAAGQTPQGAKVLERFTSFGNLKQDGSMRDRQMDIHLAWKMAMDKPFGGGLGYTVTAGDVHFSPVDVGAVAIPIELGWLGTFLYAMAVVIAIAALIYPAIRGDGMYLGLAVISLLPLLLLTDENLLASFTGLLFFGPVAFMLRSQQK